MNILQVKSAEDFAHHVTEIIEEIGIDHPLPIQIGIPGGRGGKSVVEGVLNLTPKTLSRVKLYLIDERLGEDTNYEMLYSYGLGDAIQNGIFQKDQLIIPSIGEPFIEHGKLDILFAGVGEDGHFASLFPYSRPMNNSEDIILVENSVKPPPRRVSISYYALEKYCRLSDIYLLLFGEGKRAAFEGLMRDEEDVSTLPSRYFLKNGFHVTLVTDLYNKGN